MASIRWMRAETPKVGNDGRYHIFYVVTNKINNKIYFGKHSTERLFDGYQGSGKYIMRAISKYGRDNFERIDLLFFDTEDLSLEFEELFIDKDIISDDTTYNLNGGGRGASSGELNHMFNKKGELHPNYGKDFSWVPKPHLTDPIYLENLSNGKKGRLSVRYPDGRCALLPKDHEDILSGLAVFVCVGRTKPPRSKPEPKKRGAKKGNILSQETKDKISKIKLSTKFILTEEGRKKISETTKTRISCPHCKTEGNVSNMKRWHFDNCKRKETR